MTKLIASLVCIASMACAGANERSLVLGSAISIQYANVDTPCPEDSICLDGWFRYDLSIDKVLKGPAVPHRIRAVHMQHTYYIPKYRRALRLFVLRPVETAEARANLKADYYIDDLSPVQELYCLSGTPESLGLDPSAVTVVGQERFCFSAEEARR